MNCGEAQSLIEAFIKDELSMRKTKEFIDHIESCGTCREELEVRFLVEMTAAELDNETDLDYDFANMLKNRIVEKKRRIGNYTLLAFLILLVSAVLLVLAFYYFIIL